MTIGTLRLCTAARSGVIGRPWCVFVCVMQDWQEAKARQDQQLESIEAGLGHLKEIGGAMNEELQRHDVLLNEVDDKMDKVTKELQTNNMRLKGLVTKVRGGVGGWAGGPLASQGLCVRVHAKQASSSRLLW